MTKHAAVSVASLTLLITGTQAETLLSETFSGSGEVSLVGTATPDGNRWTGAVGEAVTPEEPAPAPAAAEEPAGGAVDQEKPTSDTKADAAPTISVRQDGSVGGKAFTAYHEFDLKQGQVYTLEAALSPANEIDNQWLTVGFAVTAKNGDAVPNLDGGTTYGQAVLSGSGYRYGWIGPDTKDICELEGPGLHIGSVTVVLDATDPAAYTIEILDGEGESLHGPKSIGAPAISQIFIGNSGTTGVFRSLTLKDDKPAADAEPAAAAEPAAEAKAADVEE